ncbi:hypothetical protein HHI36_018415 [Cryptolaemus montrouzieri]|uniref:Uncharacterized protein n=1 Tax=Cryptolaemus montrouzieri TaxID=559131 RepID=A0ABD2P023_9CUCU
MENFLEVKSSLMPSHALEDEEADEVLIIPQQNASSDVESEFEADNDDEYGLQSEFEAQNSTNSQILQSVEFEEIENGLVDDEMKTQTINKIMMKLTSIVIKTKIQMKIHPRIFFPREVGKGDLNVNPIINHNLKGANRQKWNSISRAKSLNFGLGSSYEKAFTTSTELLRPIDYFKIFIVESIFELMVQ